MPTLSTKDRIISTAGLRGKTKTDIASSLRMDPSHIGKVVNQLVSEGKLTVARTTKTGAQVFTKVTALPSTPTRTAGKRSVRLA